MRTRTAESERAASAMEPLRHVPHEETRATYAAQYTWLLLFPSAFPESPDNVDDEGDDDARMGVDDVEVDGDDDVRMLSRGTEETRAASAVATTTSAEQTPAALPPPSPPPSPPQHRLSALVRTSAKSLVALHETLISRSVQVTGEAALYTCPRRASEGARVQVETVALDFVPAVACDVEPSPITHITGTLSNEKAMSDEDACSALEDASQTRADQAAAKWRRAVFAAVGDKRERDHEKRVKRMKRADVPSPRRCGMLSPLRAEPPSAGGELETMFGAPVAAASERIRLLSGCARGGAMGAALDDITVELTPSTTELLARTPRDLTSAVGDQDAPSIARSSCVRIELVHLLLLLLVLLGAVALRGTRAASSVASRYGEHDVGARSAGDPHVEWPRSASTFTEAPAMATSTMEPSTATPIHADWIAKPLAAARLLTVVKGLQAAHTALNLALAGSSAMPAAALDALSVAGGGKKRLVGRFLATLAAGSTKAHAMRLLARALRVASPTTAMVQACANGAAEVAPLLMKGMPRRALGGAVLGTICALLV
jgi:hypothetical protein